VKGRPTHLEVAKARADREAGGDGICGLTETTNGVGMRALKENDHELHILGAGGKSYGETGEKTISISVRRSRL